MDPESDIPEVFHSLETGRPFEVCIDCGEPLLEAFSYVVQKAFRRDEPIFEIALCVDCHARLLESFSEESRERLQSWFEEHLRDDEPGLERCAFTGIPRAECDEYELGAHFVGTVCLARMCISETAREQAEALLSKSTRDRWDAFIRDHVPGIPADQPAPLLI